MKKNGLAKVFAVFALVGIVISIVGTGILVIMSSTEDPKTYTSEEFKNLINISTGTTNSGELLSPLEVFNSGSLEINTSTGDLK